MSRLELRLLQEHRITTHSVQGRRLGEPTVRAVAVAVLTNPLAGRFHEDLTSLYELGAELGGLLVRQCLLLLNGAPAQISAYGKGAVVGSQGDLEHAAALLHPTFGKPVRAAIGGGADIIPSTVRLAGPGCTLTVPLFHKDDRWQFDQLDAVDVQIAEGPLESEVAVALALASGGRPFARVQKP